MANKQIHEQESDPNALQVTQRDGETGPAAIARTSLQPEIRAAITLQAYGEDFGKLDIGGLTRTLVNLVDETQDGENKHGEAMLVAQASVLNAIFNNLAKSAINSNRIERLDKYLKLAMRAQSQCRATWETIATLKNPPVVSYINQTNIAHGAQQINNGTMNNSEAKCDQKNKNLQNKLMDDKCNGEEWMDSRTEGTASQADPAMEAVGRINGSKNKGRKKSGCK